MFAIYAHPKWICEKFVLCFAVFEKLEKLGLHL